MTEIKNSEFREWRNEKGELHRDNDLPAIVWAGSQDWYQNGECHRDDDKPAVIWTKSGLDWYENDNRHRDNDKPAHIFNNGEIESQEWYKDGKINRLLGYATYFHFNDLDILDRKYWINDEAIGENHECNHLKLLRKFLVKK